MEVSLDSCMTRLDRVGPIGLADERAAVAPRGFPRRVSYDARCGGFRTPPKSFAGEVLI
jgi:hypothetical protein